MEALSGDGVPAHIVASYVQRTRVLAEQIVTECDVVCVSMRKNGIADEYQRMKQNDSTLAPLLDESIALVERALQATR